MTAFLMTPIQARLKLITMMAVILASTASMVSYANDGADVLKPSGSERYTGAPITLEFQDMPVRAVLDVLADFTHQNIVADDSVTGNISLRLNAVPWDQALAMILKMRGLNAVQEGNVLMISSRSISSTAANQPLDTAYIPLYYANAEEVRDLIIGKKTEHASSVTQSNSRREPLQIPTKNDNEQDVTTTTIEYGSLLSPRGTVTIDKRTNMLIVQDVAGSVANIKEIIQRIDVAVSQVMIEARIVTANESFGRQLGVNFGLSGQSGNLQYAGSGASLWSMRNQGMAAGSFGAASNAINLGVANPMGRIALGLLNLPNSILDLELSAMQAESRGEIISTPKVLTADKQMARIASGIHIPYQEQTQQGGTAVTFKEAALVLEVTPNITPDGKIALKLSIKNGNPVAQYGQIAIQEDVIETNVLIDHGQTVVLGGIYRENRQAGDNKVPVLGEIPVLGRLFRHDSDTKDKSELLIFITPTLVADTPKTPNK